MKPTEVASNSAQSKAELAWPKAKGVRFDSKTSFRMVRASC